MDANAYSLSFSFAEATNSATLAALAVSFSYPSAD